MSLLLRQSGTSDTALANCLASDAAGAPVYVTGPAVGSVMQVATADATDGTKVPCIGFIEQKLTATTCMVRLAGDLNGIITGLTPGKPVFLGVGNVIQAPLPPATSPYTYTQSLGVALAANRIWVRPDFTIVKRRG